MVQNSLSVPEDWWEQNTNDAHSELVNWKGLRSFELAFHWLQNKKIMVLLSIHWTLQLCDVCNVMDKT
jgi:hypothetical protein